MRKYVLAASTVVSIAALTSAANAADMAPAPSVYDWSGVYIGLNAGIGWNNSEVDGNLSCADGPLTAGFCDTVFEEIGDEVRHGVEGDDTAFTGGAMIGANWQWETFVLGVEADVNYAGFGESNSREWSGELFGTPDVVARSNADFDADWWGTVRARAGFAVDNWLFYGTGGLAWGTLDASASIDACWNDCLDGVSFRGSESDTNIGWTIGAGMEWGFDNWTLGAEYLYVDLGSADFDHRADLADVAGEIGDARITGSADVDYQFSVVRATAKWKF